MNRFFIYIVRHRHRLDNGKFNFFRQYIKALAELSKSYGNNDRRCMTLPLHFSDDQVITTKILLSH